MSGWGWVASSGALRCPYQRQTTVQHYPTIQDTVIFKGGDTCLEEIKEAMKKGMDLGESMFEENTSFSKDAVSVFS